jgi:hypothetical protein
VIALFVALGSVAGALPGKNKVNSGDIKNSSIKSADVKDDSLTGGDVNESTLKLPSTAVAKSSYGVVLGAAGNVTGSTLPGVTARLAGPSNYIITFPKSIANCVVVAAPRGDGQVYFIQGGADKPNEIDGYTYDAAGNLRPSDVDLNVTC